MDRLLEGKEKNCQGKMSGVAPESKGASDQRAAPKLPPTSLSGAPRAGSKGLQSPLAEVQCCPAGPASLLYIPLKLLRAWRSPPSAAVTVSACFTFRLVSLQQESGGRMHHPEITQAGGSRPRASWEGSQEAGRRVRLPTAREGAQTLTRPVPSSQCRSGCGAHCYRARGHPPAKGKSR